MKIENLLQEEQLTAYNEINNVIAPLWDIDRGSLPEFDRRVTLSVSKTSKRGNHKLCVHVDKRNGWINKHIVPITDKYGSIIVLHDGGEAQSSYPQNQSVFQPHATSQQIQPGVSISHGRYRSGTLGCIVLLETANGPRYFVSTASHVVAANGEYVEAGDYIYSPGRGSVPELMRKYRIGKLTDNFIEIFGMTESNPADQDIRLRIDVALIKVFSERLKDQELKNLVPHPKKPEDDNSYLAVTDVVEDDDFASLLLDEVYMFGAVSGFRRGKLTNICSTDKVIRLPNLRNAIYFDLFAVQSIDKEPFSKPGDSGAMVYNKKGQLMGFVTGADKYVTYCCVGKRCLEVFNAKLV